MGGEVSKKKKKSISQSWLPATVLLECCYAEVNWGVLQLNTVLRKHKRNWNVNDPKSKVRMQN